jgi:Domain of unknown function (DUF932)
MTHKLVEPRGIGKEALRMAVPAVFAQGPDSRVSEGYSFIPTEPLFDAIVERGLVCTGAQMQLAGRGRNTTIRDTGAHLLRFRPPLAKPLGEIEAYPEIMLLNSHDRTKRLRIIAGVFRLVCLNGMMIGTQLAPPIVITHYHMRQTLQDLVEAVMGFSGQLSKINDCVDAMQKRIMSEEEQKTFAQRAIAVRYGNYATTLDSNLLLLPRRPEDEGNDLWRVFNRAQEHLIQGGLRTGRSWTRPIVSLHETTMVNQRLWTLAEEILAKN